MRGLVAQLKKGSTESISEFIVGVHVRADGKPEDQAGEQDEPLGSGFVVEPECRPHGQASNAEEMKRGVREESAPIRKLGHDIIAHAGRKHVAPFEPEWNLKDDRQEWADDRPDEAHANQAKNCQAETDGNERLFGVLGDAQGETAEAEEND